MADQTDFLSRVIELLTEQGIRYCVLDGQGVNAYAEPVVSLDLRNRETTSPRTFKKPCDVDRLQRLVLAYRHGRSRVKSAGKFDS